MTEIVKPPLTGTTNIKIIRQPDFAIRIACHRIRNPRCGKAG
jgi:hypothetical protein